MADETIARWLAAEYLWLEREMRQVLAKLEMTSCGRTGAPRLTVAAIPPRPGEKTPSTTPSFGSADPTTGDPNPPHLLFRSLWQRAVDNADRRRLLDEMETKLRSLTHAPPPPRDLREETLDERNERLLTEGADFPAEAVAIKFRITPREVRRVRVQNARDPEWGRVDLARKLPATASADERRRHVRALHDDHHLSQHAIAALVGVSQMTVHRDLKATEGSKAA